MMKKKEKVIRYAVVGLGHIAQNAVLPAFAHAKKNSKLTAFISDDQTKVQELSAEYGVKFSWNYEQYEDALLSGEFDAVYIALPNNMHKEFTVKAANAGIHVLCEKPMACTTQECKQMIDACEKNKVKLMIAYRLHFEEANMKVVDLVQSGEIGDVRLFNSTFTMQVREGNIRTEEELGGGAIFDIGIYCLNAARYIMRDEPISVMAAATSQKQKRFREINEMEGVVMEFPDNRLASFICSFGAASMSAYDVVGTKGRIHVEPAYEYSSALQYTIENQKKKVTKFVPRHDQFAPELEHFSEAIIKDRKIGPSGEEGMTDVRIIEAILKSIHSGKAVQLKDFDSKLKRPTLKLVKKHAPIKKPKLVRVKSAHR